jgi:hypothetical protein
VKRTAVLVSIAAAVCLTFASSAAAFHIAGATYNGTHAGGGTVSFAVTPDGSGLSSFSVGGPVQGNICTFGGSSITFTQPLPIVNHAFNLSSSSTSVSGSFTGVQQASGNFRIKTFGPFSCDSGIVPWTASTNASPAGSEECKEARAALSAAKAKLRKAQKAVRKAKKAFKEADTPGEESKAKSRLRKAKARERAAKKAKGLAEREAAQVCG